MTKRIRIVIADDHVMVRGGLSMFLQSVDDFELVGQAADGAQAVQLCEENQPDVVLMDLMMPNMNGVEAMKVILKTHPETRIIALTSFKEDELVYAALQAGAAGYLLKDINYDELARTIRNAYEGKAMMPAEIAQALIRMATKPVPRQYQLSQREREVLAFIVHGLTNQQIAAALTLGESTIKFHVSSILSKLGVTTRTEAAALAVQHHLVD